MADETPQDSPADEGADPLLRLSLRTKALVIANEYTHRQMEPNELARVLVRLAPTALERARVARAIEEELRAARYPMTEIVRLMGEIVPPEEPPQASPVPASEAETAPEPASEQVSDTTPKPPEVTPANEQVLITRKVRAPHLMPFERYEFQASEGEAPAAPAPVAGKDAPPTPAEPSPPTQRMSVEDVKAAAAGGAAPEVKEAAPKSPGFSIDKFKELAKPAADEDGGARPVVLVADDDARARVMYRMKLEQSGYAVREAKDGVDAWKQIKAGGIDFLVTDMKMPGYHGLEILGRMLDSGMTIPVVVVSAFDQLENEFVVTAYPKLKFLSKPASPESVAAAVRKFAREAAKQGE
jgi:CheY-like chemotaxis protein